jgi:beta-lactam-binding protein with PASTA domain
MLFGVDPRTTTNSEVAFRELDDTQEHRPQRTQNRPPVAWIWVGILLTIAVITGVGFWVANLQPGQSPISSSVSVPNVVGASWSAASSALEQRDLKPMRVEENSDDVSRGSVIRTEPGSGTAVARQQDIRVVVSLGPEQVAVPDVANQAQADAEQTLKAAGFTIGSITSDYSTSVPQGTVLGSDPASSTSHTKGTVVNLTVSNGLVQLPAVLQQPFTTANSTLANLGLTVQSQPIYSCAGGTVAQQSAPAGDIAQGSTVTLTWCAASDRPTAPPAPTNDNGGNPDQGTNDGNGDGGN